MENKDIDTTTRPSQPNWPQQDRALRIVTAGSVVEALGGIGAVVLAILGLAGLVPMTMIGVSIVCIGGALLFAGGTMAARYNHLVSRLKGDRAEETEFGGSVGAEFLTGAAGIVLGVLVLLDIAPMVLGPIAIIAFGGGLLLSTGATSGINALVEAYPYDKRVRIAREAVQGAAAVQSLVGIGAAILGILALLGINSITLMLVSLLGLGGGILIAASAVSGRMLASSQHHR